MRIFLDTANLEEIKQAKEWGLLDGVTTNPTLLSQEGKDPREQLEKICAVVDGPVSAEVISLEAEGMVKEARDLRRIADNIVIKIPLTLEGLKAVRILSEEGIPTNVTLCFSPNQALLAAKAGATYISPFVGRLDDIGHDGMGLVRDIIEIYDNYGFDTEVIVASVRHPAHVLLSAKMGADIATIPFKTLTLLVRHPLTDVGIERFLRDWEALKEKIGK